MKIEEAIKQTKFRNCYHKLLLNLHYTDSWLRLEEGKVFKKHNLSLQQYNVLRILKGQNKKGVSVQLIKERMLDKDSNASRLVDKLLASGLISRVQCADDRRKVEVSLTDKGEELLCVIEPDIAQIDSTMKKLSEEEAETLNHLLNKIRS